MKKMKTMSWSMRARKMCYNQLGQYLCGEKTKQECIEFFSTSYRAPIIRIRAAKKFGKMLRNLNV
jgi:hypothetical protein